jgi:hypothetical protein
MVPILLADVRWRLIFSLFTDCELQLGAVSVLKSRFDPVERFHPGQELTQCCKA